MAANRICAVIPAAGRGSRLGLDCPKILAPIDESRTIWSVLRQILLPHVDHIHVVLSPQGLPFFEPILAGDRECGRISTSVQPKPVGMGDAIFGASEFWNHYETLLVVWGDQVNLSRDTLQRVVFPAPGNHGMVLPLTRPESPYVQYVLDGQKLLDVRQTREGDVTDPYGASDVGLFVLSAEDLCAQWKKFVGTSSTGAATGEINFLPFFPYLSRECGWEVRLVWVEDPDEARGVNIPADLEFTRSRLTRTT